MTSTMLVNQLECFSSLMNAASFNFVLLRFYPLCRDALSCFLYWVNFFSQLANAVLFLERDLSSRCQTMQKILKIIQEIRALSNFFLQTVLHLNIEWELPIVPRSPQHHFIIVKVFTRSGSAVTRDAPCQLISMPQFLY